MAKIIFNKEKSSLTVALFFSLFVVGILFIAFCLRLISVVLQSNYDGSHRFTFAIFPRPLVSGSGKDIISDTVMLVSIGPDTKKVGVLTLTSGEFTKHTIHKSSGVFVDGYIAPKEVKKEDVLYKYPKNEEELKTQLEKILTHYPFLDSNLTFIDVARIFLFVREQPARVFTFAQFSKDAQQDEAYVDKIVSQLFIDEEIFKERKSIAIVNGTEIGGFGGSIARLLNNIGGNVISVSTSSKPLSTSKILYKNKSYTSKRLGVYLPYTQEIVVDTGIADIVIQLGKDSVATNF